jgi:hypothetical protein
VPQISEGKIAGLGTIVKRHLDVFSVEKYRGVGNVEGSCTLQRSGIPSYFSGPHVAPSTLLRGGPCSGQ